MKKFETTKLYWDKYLYKLVIYNRIGTIFRDKNLSHARQVLDTMQQLHESGESIKLERHRRVDYIQESHFLDAHKLYKFFSNSKDDYTLRIEGNTTCIYSNDKSWLNSVNFALHYENVLEFWGPNPEHIDILKDVNTIIVDKETPYLYKVSLGRGRMSTTGFANWADKNPKQVKIGPVLKEELLINGYVNGMYFYARDEKTIQLCTLMLDNIRRIDKLVVKTNIDKY